MHLQFQVNDNVPKSSCRVMHKRCVTMPSEREAMPTKLLKRDKSLLFLDSRESSVSRLLQRCFASQFAVPYFGLFESSYNHRFSDILFELYFPQEVCSFFLATRRFTTWLCFRKSTAFS